MKEASIRDLLVDQLGCLEPGLEFIDKEKYLPSNIGTKSFIDIVARDSEDNWVIIELKRSDSTARQAIHEVLKYTEAVKSHLGVRADEIRTMIVSTEWSELLVPFSKFYSDTSLDIEGYLLDISDPKQLASIKVAPLKITAGRTLSPWHELNYYSNTENLQKGLQSYVDANKKKGIDSYVIVMLDAPSGHHEMTLAATREGMANVRRQFGDEADYDEIDASLESMVEYKHILYFVPQLLSENACVDALQQSGEDMDELREILEDMGEEETLCVLHEHLFSAEPKTHNERYEIGDPAKFKSRLIDAEGWSISSITRYGALARNMLLTDETIISEICGETGVTGQKYKRSISMARKSQLSAAKSEIAECLSTNPVWSSNILAHLNEIESDHPDAEVDISIFNPSTGLFTLFFAVTKEQGILFVPTYSLLIRNDGNASALYFGELAADGNSRTFQEVINEFYNGDIGSLLMNATWGYREPQDSKLLEFIGIHYRSYRCDIDGESRQFFAWRDNVWRAVEPVTPFDALASFFEHEQAFMTHLVTKVGRRLNGGIADGSCNYQPLRAFCGASNPSGPKFAASELPSHCDRCKCAFVEEEFLVDTAIPGHRGVWAYLCADCVAETGATIGWGSGQLYQQSESGDWQLVAGGRPETDTGDYEN